MPNLVIEALADASGWVALAPDGNTASTSVSMATDPAQRPPLAVSSVRIAALAGAADHTLRRTIAALDLSGFDQIQLWILASAPAIGSVAQPLFLELRLASSATSLTDPANSWARFLPVSRAAAWEPVRLSITDLPVSIRAAVDTLELRCASPAPFSCNLSALWAVHDALIADTDAALLQALNGTLSLAGMTVPAIVHPVPAAHAPALPYFEITQLDVVFARERTESTSARVDYNQNSYALRSPGFAYEIYYQVCALAADRPTQATMMEWALQSLPARGTLLVNGLPVPMESVYIQPIDRIGGFRTDQVPLSYRVSARQVVGATEPAVPARNLTLAVDQPGP